ncbi:hypothetical protein JOD82_001996 [Paenibacillus sp. 1182]|uniref:hypothetical protein n=1 Tax=Paenibacillus sp. 1182 TaxID=2806565 RepID=UPI001AEA1473|nr:hypothetical protein [Paenibacillus sp. 1182]MBP1308976.1 hypothetical protein [Paenibacillus sp. 1182]
MITIHLYEIRFEHFAPKDSKGGILSYLGAESDEDVYEWLKSNPLLSNEQYITTTFKDDEEIEFCDEDGESFKDRMVRLQGNINDDEAELSDLYYGATLHGWKLKKENITSKEIETLRSLGIQVETVIQ